MYSNRLSIECIGKMYSNCSNWLSNSDKNFYPYNLSNLLPEEKMQKLYPCLQVEWRQNKLERLGRNSRAWISPSD